MAVKKWPTEQMLQRLSPELLANVPLPTRVAKDSDLHNLHTGGPVNGLILPEARPYFPSLLLKVTKC